MAFGWFGREPEGRRQVELMLGPQDGAVIAVGPDVAVWETTDGGRYAPIVDGNPNRFYWETGSPA